MSLSKQELDDLLRLVDLTADDEIDCPMCLEQVAEFAEQQLTGKVVSAGLKAVERHLAICGECREEYEALQRGLRGLERGKEGKGGEGGDSCRSSE
jgi:hypothetical protein